MIKSEILDKLHNKHSNLEPKDIETIFDIFTKKIISSLEHNQKIEIRGFGTISKKISIAKYVRNPKTNEKIYKNESYKLHFKIGKSLHKKLNPNGSSIEDEL